MGPVQDFIASARRCQDLWFGSWLLSDLARTTAASLRDAGGTVIFPASVANPPDGPDRPGVANIILARLDATIAPRQAAEAARSAQQDRLEAVAQAAWKHLDADPDFHRTVAQQQLGELIEFTWVAQPLIDGDYALARRRAYRHLAAQKNTRRWTQPPWTDQAGVGVPKSSLDGE
ncbi:MAG: type III-B CRISPR-associated protein Cas10/Cmr2, partial [Oligoflexia bacterium]|nr:type III-B CRISPR-associated protein Cas10/Cmr2 [Oligoflexia bacterium]